MGVRRRQPINDCDEQDESSMKVLQQDGDDDDSETGYFQILGRKRDNTKNHNGPGARRRNDFKVFC